ncbi:sugar ABC transporter substrate-binding protein [Schlegelella sp. S2-27]|uniref:Sugar ABC transporter substrate-binding protein n=1 Tax=Caldimonas mangrovi TaxID=2944811 RepID=A0ABT0YN41_9BURK|nr:sugar ABC transporter substrate-binding protein [Caldimonas mangrovi]MCM5680126.1 sugar ABC transporter substrate-binding protein [Caldimonas mangrovi]
MKLHPWALGAALLVPPGAGAVELSIATVDNGHMIRMQALTPHFEKANPGIRVKWVTLSEGDLREQVSADIAGKGGRYDVVTIGMYEVPIWARKGWLRPFQPDDRYDAGDLLPAMRKGLSLDGKLYAAPFYGESSMLMYRRDLLHKAGAALSYQPTWDEVKKVAAKLHDPAAGVYGICLRGKPGWGDNMALLTTMVNTFGGQWFDMSWRPRIDSEPWKRAIGFYVDLLKNYGPPQPAHHSFNENLALFNAGKCGMWIDATIAASFVSDPKQSKVADKVAFAQAPTAVTPKGASWLWAWSLAIPAGTTRADAAQRFVNWATSREYIELVARTDGWARIPTGTRTSTYKRPEFLQAAGFAFHEAMAIAFTDPGNSTLPKSPYVGVQFASIPEFQAIGNETGRRIGAALEGQMSVDEALSAAQKMAEAEMRQAGGQAAAK